MRWPTMTHMRTHTPSVHSKNLTFAVQTPSPTRYQNEKPNAARHNRPLQTVHRPTMIDDFMRRTTRNNRLSTRRKTTIDVISSRVSSLDSEPRPEELTPKVRVKLVGSQRKGEPSSNYQVSWNEFSSDIQHKRRKALMIPKANVSRFQPAV